MYTFAVYRRQGGLVERCERRRFGDVRVTLVRRIEAAAEQPDLHAGIGQRKVAPHVVRRILA